MAAHLDFTLDQGATWCEVLRWQAGSPAAPVDLSGCTARLHVRTHYAAATPVLTLTMANGGLSLGGAAGTISIEVSATATAALAARHYVYDLEIVHISGRVTRLCQGAMTVTPEVTR